MKLSYKGQPFLTDKSKVGYSLNPINENVPLKRFLKYDYYNNCLTAYKAYKNQGYYY